MAERAEMVLARAWRRSCETSTAIHSEKALEDALAAALEDVEFWKHFRERLPWIIPSEPPTVVTQEVLEEGRTDITLTWVGAEFVQRFILELKLGGPPSVQQILQYVASNTYVAAVARYVGRVTANGFLGVLTWRWIRDLDWPGAPLIARQLFHLIDAMGIAMPRISTNALAGLVSSYAAWDVMRRWSFTGMEAVRDELERGGLVCVFREGNKGRYWFEDGYNRYAYSVYPRPWYADFRIFGGLFFERGSDRTLADGAPDLMLTVHIEPDSALAQSISSDAELATATEKWNAIKTRGVHEVRLLPGTWEVLRARISMAEFLAVERQEEEFVAWMRQQASDFVESGIAACLGVLHRHHAPSANAAISAPQIEPGDGSP